MLSQKVIKINPPFSKSGGQKTYVVTGGTGFLGSRLSVDLLSEGNKVIFLTRAKNEHRAYDRVFSILKQIEPTIDKNLIQVIEVDLNMKNLLLHPEITKLKEIDAVWHLSANLSFKEEKRKEIFNDNIVVLENILSFVTFLKCPIYYTSTAYIHGRINKNLIQENVLVKPVIFNNPYEESKYEAERIIFEWGKENKNSFIIFRPSILVEYRRHTLSFFGYYSVIAGLENLKQKMTKFYKKHPNLSKFFGLNFKNNILHAFIPFPYIKNVFLNLMPVNVAIEWMIVVAKNKKSLGNIFHITNPNPFSMEEVTKQTLSGLNLQLLTFKAPEIIIASYFSFIGFLGIFNKDLKSFARILKFYKFYMLHSNHYVVENTRLIVGKERFDKEFKFEEHFLENLTRNFIAKLKERQKLS
ncbi:MAG: SDR family oxidoreductase [Patescibacteria group bacterium]